MSASMILALALIQAPAASAIAVEPAFVNADPRLATGIEVVRIQPPTPVGEAAPVEAIGPVVVGVVPSIDPNRWAVRSAPHWTYLGAGMVGWAEDYWMWAAQRAQLAELYETDGYRTGTRLAAEKARAEGRPPPPVYGLAGGPAPGAPTRSSASSTSRGTSDGNPGGSVGGGSGGGKSTGAAGKRDLQ